MSFPPTFKQLRYLLALHKTNHFGRAADACHVTQSTLSAGIQELESLLNAQLVERSKRSVMFTPLGKQIVERAQRIMNEVDELTALAAAANNPFDGPLRLGLIPTIAPFLLPEIMPSLTDDFPDIDWHLREDKSGILCDQLKSGDLDLILYALPFDCGEVEELPLFEDRFFAAFPEGKATVKKITRNDLKHENLMLLEEGHCLRDHALAACQLLDADIKKSMSGTSLQTIAQMVASGQGVTLLPEMAIRSGMTQTMAIDILPFADMDPCRTIGLVWRKTSPRGKTFRAIGKTIQAAVDKARKDK